MPTQSGSWNDFASVVVYLYTHTKNTLKYKLGGGDGYGTLIVDETGRRLSGTITSTQSKTLNGALIMDIMIESDGGENAIRRIITGVEIYPTPIKEEV